MAASVSPELSLGLRPSYVVPETINGFLREVSMIEDVKERLQKVDEFLKRLDEEMKKIQAFERELPLSMLLLKDAISVLKLESSKHRITIASEPVLEEFIPLRKEADDEEKPNISDENDKKHEEDCSKDKKNWMSSVQLWNADNIPSNSTASNITNQNQTLVSESQKGEDKSSNVVNDDLYGKIKHWEGSKDLKPMIQNYYPSFPEIRRKIQKEDVNFPGISLPSPGIKHLKQDSISCVLNSKFGGSNNSRISSSASAASNSQSYIRPGPQQSTSRKQRRCWCPELHRKFLDALTKLGGPQAATPKQIRELMRVDGLTNDEVKSHLQKYRLHTRRVANNSTPSTNESGNSLTTSWATRSESSKPGSSQSGSPQGPLQFSSMEEDEDEKSESYGWKHQGDRSLKDDV